MDGPTPGDASTTSRQRFAAKVSLAVGLVMLGLKWGAFAVTGSRAILSDALESIVHVGATAFALLSVYLSTKPPDRSYPYGYGKIAYVSAGFEGGLILVTALVILYEGIEGLMRRSDLTRVEIGLGLVLVATITNIVLGGWLVHLGKSTNSIILEADGHHVLSDAWTSAAVVIGIIAVALSRWWWLDSAIAIVMGLNILRTGFRLARQSLHGLLDFADPELLETIVDALASRREAGWLDLHQLRASRAGNRTFVDFHLVVPADWNVARLHDSIEHARGALRDRLGPETDVVIHFDPDTSTLLDRVEGRWSVSHAIRRPLREAANPSQLPT